MKTRKSLAAAGLLSLALGAAAVPAAHAKGTVVAKNLSNPRGVALGPDGAVYVAEAGSAGKQKLDKETAVGNTGRISKVVGTTRTTVAKGFLSVGGPDGSFAVGIDDVTVAPDGTVYTIMTDAPPKQAKGLPKAITDVLGHVLKVEGSGEIAPLGDIGKMELKNPDKTDVNPNPYGITTTADTQYVADAGGNTIYSSQGTTVKLLSILPKLGTGKRKAQAVPTTIRIGPDGALYVGVLGGEPPTSKKQAVVFRVPIEGGKATVFAKGFGAITGIAFDTAGNLYVSEFSQTFGKEGPKGDGRVVKIAKDTGARTSVTKKGDLTFPAGVAVGADNAVYVSNFSIAPGKAAKSGPFKGITGQLVRFAQTG